MLSLKTPPPRIAFTGNPIHVVLSATDPEASGSESGEVIPASNAMMAIAVKGFIYDPPGRFDDPLRLRLQPYFNITAGSVTYTYTCVEASLYPGEFPNPFRTANLMHSTAEWAQQEIIPVLRNTLSSLPGAYAVTLLPAGNQYFPDYNVILIVSTEPGTQHNLSMHSFTPPERWDNVLEYSAIPAVDPSDTGDVTEPQQPGMAALQFLSNSFPRMILRIDSGMRFSEIALPPVFQVDDITTRFDISPILYPITQPIPEPEADFLSILPVEHIPLPRYKLSAFLSYLNDFFSGSTVFPDDYYLLHGRINESSRDSFLVTLKDFFFTHQPDTVAVGSDQPISLYYLNQDEAHALFIRFLIRYQDQSTLEHIVDAGVVQPVTMLAFSFSSLALPQSQPIASFDVQLVDADGQRVTYKRTYHVVAQRKSNYFLFRNSLGSFDSIAMPNRAITIRDTVKDYPDDGNYSQYVRSRLARQFFPDTLDANWRRYLRELIMSPEIYHIQNNSLVRLTQGAMSLPEVDSRSHAFVSDFVLFNTLSDEYIH
jgi:hypothetical protein